MKKYRVREGNFGTCVLQVLYEPPNKDMPRWEDVKYNEAPSALMNEMDARDKFTALEVEIAELEGRE